MSELSPLPPRLPSSHAHRALPLCALLVASALAGCAEPPRQRKNVKDLTAVERQEFVNAVLTLKRGDSPYQRNMKWYDQFVTFHKQVYHDRLIDRTGQEYQIGHESPTFLPWHRKFLLMYEQALSEVSNKDIPLPYWDWTDPSSIEVVFHPDFMGPGGKAEEGYAVTESEFAKGRWAVSVFSEDEQMPGLDVPYLVRNRGALEALPTAEDMEYCLSLTTYDRAPWSRYTPRASSFRSCLEGWGTTDMDNHLHNSGHAWVGGFITVDGKTYQGSMASVDTSPNDPIFFLHHANVDRIWALWQERHGGGYVPDDDDKPGWNPGWSPEDSLYPFDRPEYRGDSRVKLYGNTVGDMLDMGKLGYEYR